jgi:hypothetical protein
MGSADNFWGHKVGDFNKAAGLVVVFDHNTPIFYPGYEGLFLFLGLLGDWQGGKMGEQMMRIEKTLLPL